MIKKEEIVKPYIFQLGISRGIYTQVHNGRNTKTATRAKTRTSRDPQFASRAKSTSPSNKFVRAVYEKENRSV